VSVLSFGSWVTFKTQLDVSKAAECLAAAYESGVNFFDNAEVYALGESERIMGKAIRSLGWARHNYVLTTKFFWGIHDGPNTKNTLNRKYLMQAMDASLERYGMDFVDVIYCHRPDPNTPLEETVWAMHDLISSGKALYWGTSEWSADDIRGAWEIAQRHHLHKPIVEQPQYHLFERTKVERDYARLYEDVGLGLSTWSPLASGLLTGKYVKGIPEGSRGSLPEYGWLRERLTDPKTNGRVQQLQAVAQELGCTLAQLAIAWCARNPRVSTVITGASRPEQVKENMKAVDVIGKLTPQVLERIDAAVSAG